MLAYLTIHVDVRIPMFVIGSSTATLKSKTKLKVNPAVFVLFLLHYDIVPCETEGLVVFVTARECLRIEIVITVLQRDMNMMRQRGHVSII